MCRWFAYISPSEEVVLEDVLILPNHSISKQMNDHYLPQLMTHSADEFTTQKEIAVRNKLLNIDGFGVVWYTPVQSRFNSRSGQRPAMYKSAQPPIGDFNFRSLCANTASRVCFAHIRAATATAVTPVNNHPFVFGRYSFMHNGYISDFHKLKRQIGNLIGDAAYGNVQGSTDSEHLAALFISYLFPKGDKEAWEQESSVDSMADAMRNAIEAVITLQQSILGSQAQPNDLNVAITDGTHMLCCRFRNHATEQPPSLYFSESAGATMNRCYPDQPDGGENPLASKKESEHPRHVIVASEPSTYKDSDWKLIKKNNYLIFDGKGKVEIRPCRYERSWDAVVNDE